MTDVHGNNYWMGLVWAFMHSKWSLMLFIKARQMSQLYSRARTLGAAADSENERSSLLDEKSAPAETA